MRSKKLLWQLCTFCLILAVALVLVPSCAKPAETETPAPTVEKPIEAKVTHTFGVGSWPGRQVDKLAEGFGKATNGKLHVTVYPAKQMFATGDEEAAASMSGIVEFGFMYVPHLTQYDERWNVLSMPGCITSMDQCQRVHFESPLYQKLNDDLGEKTGAKVLYWSFLIPYGDCPFNTKRPLITLDDWKGLKMRVAPSEIQQEAVKALGGSPVMLQTAEVLAALSQGVVDGGVITPGTAMSSWSAIETLPHLTIPYGGWSFTTSIVGFLVNIKWWESLPQEMRDQIEGAIPAIVKASQADVESANAEAFAKYEAANTVTYLTEEQTKVWRDIVDKDIVPSIAAKYKCQDMYEEFQKYR